MNHLQEACLISVGVNDGAALLSVVHQTQIE